MNRKPRLLPQPIDNEYNGSPIAKWVFILLTLITLGRSLAHIFLPDGGAQSIATIPLDGFTGSGAATVIGIFALWGLSQLIVAILYVIVLARYQSLIPLMYLLLFVEYAGRLAIGFTKPIELTGTAPGSTVTLILIPLSLMMLWLSLQPAQGA